MEKLFRKNPDIDPKIMNNIDMTGITTDQRVEIWGNTHPVGFTITKLHQSILDGTAQNFLFFKYEDFCQFPDEHMKKMYGGMADEDLQHLPIKEQGDDVSLA